MQVDQQASEIYSRAVFGIAQERGKLTELRAEVSELADLFATTQGRALQKFWESPATLVADKLTLVDTVFGNNLSPLTKNLMLLLLRKLRIENLPLVLSDLKRRVDEAEGLSHAIVETAYALSDAERENAQQKLQKFTGCRLAIDFRVHPQLIGGMVFKFGDTLVDGSIRARLDEVRNRLMRVKVVGPAVAAAARA